MHPLLHRAVPLLAWLLALTWLARAVTSAIGLRRVPNLLHPAFDRVPPGNPALTVIVPACNEEADIRDCIQSLLDQDYPHLHILAIDDRSTDSTGAILDDLAALHPARLTALHITHLPPGWLGKTHAMALAARHAITLHQPAWLLFTDGDVRFHPQALRRSLVAASGTRAASGIKSSTSTSAGSPHTSDHFVTLPTPIVKTIGESMLLGFFQVMSFFAIRLNRVPDPRFKRDSIGVGAFALVRTAAYQEVGGFEAIRLDILEDLAFGQRIKRSGLRQAVALAPGLVSVHWAAGVPGLVGVLTKNLFALFRFNIALLLAACVSILTLGLAPVLGLALPLTRLPALVALLAIAILYRLAFRLSGNPRSSFFLFPVAALVLTWSLLRSMILTLRQGGVRWRGTFYPLAELRRNRSANLL